ncbi:hypothetical protein D9756_002707 [Leucocoprinus leucothites]|uniref:Aminoglycoside phosphotransferase domain-containing protein n=1 Tax=Leucocoprinus leucothites TaxID=201217 RepID=A0A8H5LM24_9AGAR|nr:hypothetical protein D9756_002707 [Leucoagaricus leucothites]
MSQSATISPTAWVPKPQSSWMNRISALVINTLIKIGKYYRRRNNIPDKHRDPFFRTILIHELPFNLIIKFSRQPVKESIATMTAHAMGLPVPRILCYTDQGPQKGGYILMTRIPGETLWDSHRSYSDEELAAIMVEVGDCLQQIRRFRSPYGNAVCGPDGRRIYTRAVPDGTWRRRESPEDFHDDMLICARSEKDDYPEEYAEVGKLKDKSYRVVFAHGDLHLGNIVVKDGHLSGLIDWGDAGWYPEYWDFVLPMPLWSKNWGWIVDLFYSMPGGEAYEQERESFSALAYLVSPLFC